jgi:hypothetical protein
MAIYCEDCHNYSNQVCGKCGQTFGLLDCEIYGCGGKMVCSKCGSTNLNPNKRPDHDPHDARWKSAQIPKCECGYEIDTTWVYCPLCGSQLKK